MKLTKEEAIRRHRMMWEWIADETLKRKECVNKLDAFKHFGWDTCPILTICWCCEYASRIDTICICDHCPIKWPSKATYGLCTRFEDGERILHGLYGIWVNAMDRDDWRTAAYYALYISMLPERKD